MYEAKEKIALKAGFWYVISDISLRAVSVITTPLFTRLMTTYEYVVVQTFSSWYALLATFFTLNLSYSIGRAKLDFPGKLDRYVGSMQLLAALMSLILSTIILLFLKPISSLFELSQIQTLILTAYLFFQSPILLNQNSYRYKYQYRQNIAIAWYSTLSTTLLSMILMLIFKNHRENLRIIGLALPTVALSMFFWVKNIRNTSINKGYWEYGLKLSLPLILHAISLHILSQSDRIFISKIWGKSDTGLYSLAYQLGSLLSVVTGAISQGWLPWFHDTLFSKQFDTIKENVKPIVILGCYIGLGCIVFAPEAIFVLGGEKYRDSIPCVMPVVLGVICQYIYTHYVNIELHLKKTMYVSAGTIIAALFNIITNAIFIPKYGFVAAAYTTLASYFLLMAVHFSITRKVLHVRLYNDIFMFCAMFVTTIIAGLLSLSYGHSVVRLCFAGVGFLSFIYYFRSYILRFASKRRLF